MESCSRNARFTQGWCYSLLILGFTISPFVSAECLPRPIPVRVGNVSLSNGRTARGLDLAVGSPQQHFAFLPQWPLNNTIVYGTNGFCDTEWSPTGCTTFRGGQYSQLESESVEKAAPDDYPREVGEPYPAFDYITDNFTLNPNTTVASHPIGIVLSDFGQQGYFPQMGLGLGLNSTILTRLKKTGQIASRSWSMFWGRTGAITNSQLDGGFVFGGYDRAKVTGENHTQKLSGVKSACATEMLITITDIVLNFANGTNTSLFAGLGAATAITACIVPSYPVLMTMPRDPYFDVFEQATNQVLPGRSFGIYYFGVTYNMTEPGSDSPYTGDMTFQLDSGLAVRVPNDQLVVPNLSIDPETGELEADASAPELVINPIQAINAGDLPQLGRQFLTSAYVMVNQDSREFTLWKANPTSRQDLVAVNSKNQVVDEFCVSNGTSVDPNNEPTAPSKGPDAVPSPIVSSTPDSPPIKLGTGVIAGIAVGAVALLAAVGLVAFLVMRRRKASARAMEENSNSTMTQNWSAYQSPISYKVQEGPQEMYQEPHTYNGWKKDAQELPS